MNHERQAYLCNVLTSYGTALEALIPNASEDCPVLNSLALMFLDNLEKSLIVDDVQEIQADLCKVLTRVIRKLGKKILELTDRIMVCILSLMNSPSIGLTLMKDSFLVIVVITVSKVLKK